MNTTRKGILTAIFSAFIFGLTPILVRITYDEGSNGITMAFLRAALPLLILAVIMKVRKIPFAMTFAEMRSLLFAGVAIALTTIFLYSSFSYISVGEAITLHFIYPWLVSLCCVFFFKEKLTMPIITALILSVIGVLLKGLSFEGISSKSFTGFILALASGVTFALYLLCVDKSSLRYIPTPKITLGICVVSTLFIGLYGAAGFDGELTFNLTLKGWILAWIVAITVSVVATTLLQLGIKYIGAAMAAILLTLEPITGVVFGVLFLKEIISPIRLIGCICIIAGVLIVTIAGMKTSIPENS